MAIDIPETSGREHILSRRAPLVVPFHGERAAEGPLTYGQLNILRWLEHVPESYGWMRWALDLPDGATLDDVSATFAVLLARHEGLRSVCAAGPPPFQRTVASGTLTVHLLEAAPTSGAAPDRTDATDLADELGRHLDAEPPLDPRTFPLRVTLAVRGDAVLAGVVEYSHMTGDFLSIAILEREFTEMVRTPSARAVDTHPRHQPLDQAWAERRPPLAQRTEGALAHWEKTLLRAPHHLYVNVATTAPRGSAAVELRSEAAAIALAHVRTRTGIGRAGIVLAAICALLSRRTGYPSCDFITLSGNRYDRRLTDHLGTLVQAVPLQVDVGAARSFDTLVSRSWLATVKAGRYGIYDVDRRSEIAERIQHERGVRFCFEPLFNNVVVGRPASPSAPVRTPAEMRDARSRSTLSWQPMADTDVPVRFDLFETDDVLRLRLWSGHLNRLPEDELEQMLLAVENLLVSAATGDLDREQMDAALGLGPIARDGDWLLIDSCWIQPSDVQCLLDEALAPFPCRVFPDAGGRSLVAYLAESPRVTSPEQAHTACVHGLARRPTAMTPQWYVLCEGAPLDVTDLDAWLRLPVLAEGSGRGTEGLT